MDLQHSFVVHINELEQNKDVESLKKELRENSNKPSERFYISSALSFIMNKTVSEVEDLIL